MRGTEVGTNRTNLRNSTKRARPAPLHFCPVRSIIYPLFPRRRGLYLSAILERMTNHEKKKDQSRKEAAPPPSSHDVLPRLSRRQRVRLQHQKDNRYPQRKTRQEKGVKQQRAGGKPTCSLYFIRFKRSFLTLPRRTGRSPRPRLSAGRTLSCPTGNRDRPFRELRSLCRFFRAPRPR